MDHARVVKISKYLSKHLRHQPERLGLTLGTGGWVEVEQLLASCAAHQFVVSRDELNEVVATNDKRRFAFDETGTRIRANQGHSVDVDLKLEPSNPPDVLYHGTGRQHVDSILRTGLVKMARHHVHLTADFETAVKVGARHGSPEVFVVETAALVRDGHTFYRSANGVWLVDAVPASYLRLLPKADS
jgi:putative RNA 2'-phosphotransferase